MLVYGCEPECTYEETKDRSHRRHEAAAAKKETVKLSMKMLRQQAEQARLHHINITGYTSNNNKTGNHPLIYHMACSFLKFRQANGMCLHDK